jgi:hypothetical protein
MLYEYTVKEVRGKVSFYSQNGKYASQLSCDASPEAYLSLRVTVKRICHLVKRCDKYATGEASQDNCEAYFSFCESNHTLPRAPFRYSVPLVCLHAKLKNP